MEIVFEFSFYSSTVPGQRVITLSGNDLDVIGDSDAQDLADAIKDKFNAVSGYTDWTVTGIRAFQPRQLP